MPTLAIRRFPDPLLKQPTRPVTRVDAKTARFIGDLVQTMRHHPRCVGLAAPQVGSPLRIAVMDSSRNPKSAESHGLLILVNPQLMLMGERGVQREGCLSVPHLTANVRRATRVVLKAHDQFGSSYEQELTGFEAIVAQHEVDHLDGQLFLDRVVNLKTDVFRRKAYL